MTTNQIPTRTRMRPPQRLVVIALGMVLWPLGDTRAHWPALAA